MCSNFRQNLWVVRQPGYNCIENPLRSFEFVLRRDLLRSNLQSTEGAKMLRKHKGLVALGLLAVVIAIISSCNQQSGGGNTASNTTTAKSDGLDRTVLPIPEPKRPTYKELDARNVKPPERWEVKAPE